MASIEDEIAKLCKSAGFGVAVGAEAVIEKIIDLAGDGDGIPRCSGYQVFPDGEKCGGCPDCNSTQPLN